MIRRKSLRQSCFIVIRPLNQWLTSHVIFHRLLGGIEKLVIRATGSWVDKSTSDASDEKTVIDLELDGVHERLVLCREHFVELRGLGDCAREAVKDESEIKVLVRVALTEVDQ
jgi:hypothetical protein